MKLTNFTYLKKVATNLYSYTHYATVDKTTGFLWWKKTKTVTVFNDEPSFYWKFLDTGEHTPGIEVEQMFISHLAKDALK